jgi:hypothetical protein
MNAGASRAGKLSMQVVGGPTVVLEIGGRRLITDPTFDPPGSYDTGRGFALTKLRGPAIGRAYFGSPAAVSTRWDLVALGVPVSPKERFGVQRPSSVALFLLSPGGNERRSPRRDGRSVRARLERARVHEPDGTKVCELPDVVGDIREWLSELLRQLVRTQRPIRQGGKDLATERVSTAWAAMGSRKEPS